VAAVGEPEDAEELPPAVAVPTDMPTTPTLPGVGAGAATLGLAVAVAVAVAAAAATAVTAAAGVLTLHALGAVPVAVLVPVTLPPMRATLVGPPSVAVAEMPNVPRGGTCDPGPV
jgi:hypothetical protein